MTRLYTWSGHGNLGDDWLSEVAVQYLDVQPVREVRTWRPSACGRYRLHPSDDGCGPLVLWGGGWLAADQAGATTMARWARHVRSERHGVWAFGLGLGPFRPESARARKDLETVLGAMRHPIVVRAAADLEQLPSEVPGVLGCDLALLDRRWWDRPMPQSGRPPASSAAEQPYVVVSAPRYGDHWRRERPWLTRAWYREWVTDAVADLAASHGPRTVFVDFDVPTRGPSDSEYWRGLTDRVARPSSLAEAATLLAGAGAVLAARLHPAVLAAVLGVPTLAMAYHHKFAVVAELGIPTAGLAGEPVRAQAPAIADRSALERVRKRGHSLLQCNAQNWIGRSIA